MKLIVQIPAYNEEATIASAIRDIPKKIEGITSIETLVVDDGSIDRTAESAGKAGATHIVQLKTHRGLSAAFVAGLDAALRLGADIIVNTDADNQYNGADIARLVAPIVRGSAEVVIGDRQIATSPHMSPLKRSLQRLGSWTVGLASGVAVSDVTSGFRAFSREAAMQINVFNPFTYTLETVIQAGNHNLGVQSVPVRTNAPTRPSRLYSGVGTYLRKSVATIFRVYTVYRPLKTFFVIGSLLMLAGVALGARFLYFFFAGDRGGHIQSLILAAVLLITGFHTWLMALLADLVGVNRRLSEDMLLRLKRLEMPQREQRQRPQRERLDRPRRDRAERPEPQRAGGQHPPAPQPASKPDTQWVWLLDEEKLQGRLGPEQKGESAAPDLDEDQGDEIEAAEETAQPNVPRSSRRRRRRRGGMRQSTDLPGNRGKHLGDNGE